MTGLFGWIEANCERCILIRWRGKWIATDQEGIEFSERHEGWRDTAAGAVRAFTGNVDVPDPSVMETMVMAGVDNCPGYGDGPMTNGWQRKGREGYWVAEWWRGEWFRGTWVDGGVA